MSTRTAMRDRVCIGQVWRRKRDRTEMRIRQVWRADRQVSLSVIFLAGTPSAKPERVVVSFSDLRRLWELIG